MVTVTKQPASVSTVPGAPRPDVPPARSELAERAARLFDLPVVKQAEGASAPPAWAGEHLAPPAAGEVLLLAGPSGGGKLRRLVADARATVIDVAKVRLRRVPCVDQFGRSKNREADLKFAAEMLARVGLAEAFVFLRLPEELSDGQRWRLRLAVATAQTLRRHGRLGDYAGPTLIVADEFCALLDRVTASIVARSLRRTIDRLARVGVPVSAAVATSHDDLRPALLPDRVVWCELGIRPSTAPQRDAGVVRLSRHRIPRVIPKAASPRDAGVACSGDRNEPAQ